MAYVFCVVVDMFLLFNDTATTDIYTYGHTLSRHDALPILRQETAVDTVRTGRVIVDDREAIAKRVGKTVERRLRRRLVGPGSRCRQNHRQRSEEHTSELQELMRIPYAVFCLKQKKQ